MTTKLEPITTQYRKFVENQVLTEDQLNEFLEYFEDQDHQSRIGLIGVGIVCGFHVKFNDVGPTITIGQGYGVTTDGDLITLNIPYVDDTGLPSSAILKSIDIPDKTYTHYKSYDNSKVIYPFFHNADGSQIDLDELCVDEEIDLTNPGVHPLSDMDLTNKVVLLYLENYPKDEELCSALSCDNQGIEQVSRLRVLLVSRDDAQFIIGQDPIYQKHDWKKVYVDLPNVSVPKVVLNGSNTQSLSAVRTKYYDAIKQTGLLSDLKIGFNSVFEKLGQAPLDSAVDDLFNFSVGSIPADIQYRYDVLKDLVDTYKEVKELLLHINVECTPDINAFPKHLLLGWEIDEVPDKVLKSSANENFRHRFYKSPILGDEDENLKKVLSLVKRARNIVNEYQVPSFPTLKITPSQAHSVLSEKAIPFYYQVDNAEETFLKNWSHPLSQNLDSDKNLSYHVGDLCDDGHIQNPLEYNLDDFDFFRIEGHQGMTYQDAFNEIEAQKEAYGLGFDVKVLSIDEFTDEAFLKDYKCQYQDLEIMFNAFLAELLCTLAAMFKIFSNLPKALNQTSLAAVSTMAGRSKSTVKSKRETFDNALASGFIMNLPDSENDNLGAVLKRTKIENPNDCSGDLVKKSKDLIAQLGGVEESPENDSLTEDSLQLMILGDDLINKTPHTLQDFSEQSIADYQISMERFSAQVNSMKAIYSGSTRTNKNLTAINNVLTVTLALWELSSFLCSLLKILYIWSELQKRKENIAKQLRLSEFIKSHPSLEHKAGVPLGGTFVMLFRGFGKGEPLPGASVTIQRTAAGTLTDIDGNYSLSVAQGSRLVFSYLQYETITVDIGTQTKIDVSYDQSGRATVASSGNSNTSPRTITGTITVMGSGGATAENIVVADFALPYLCCSDCSPVNFVIPQVETAPIEPETEDVDLGLPNDEICSDKDKIKFNPVQPSDGVVEAVVAQGQNGGVILEEDGYWFAPREVDASLYGTPITFTVNGQTTDCEITVKPAPNFIPSDFDVQFLGYTGDWPNFEAEYKFTTSVPEGEDFTIEWQIDGTTVQGEDNAEFTTSFPLGQTPGEVSVIITNRHGCEQRYAFEEIEIPEPEITMNTPDGTYCQDDNAEYPIEVFVDGQVIDNHEGIDLSGDGIEFKNGKYIFIPAQVTDFSEPVALELSGEVYDDHNIAIADLEFDIALERHEDRDVNPVPEKKFSFKIENETGPYHTVEWTITPGNFQGTGREYSEWLPLPDENNEFTVSVVVTTENGCEFEDSMDFSQEKPTTEPDCRELTRGKISEDYDYLQSLLGRPSNENTLASRTMQLYATVLTTNTDAYLNGNMNSGLPGLFGSLPQDTYNALKNAQGRQIERLGVLLEYQIRLFLYILKCQDAIDDNIGNLLNAIRAIIQDLLARNIPFDEDESLKNFLEELLNDPSTAGGLKQKIQEILSLYNE